MDPWVVAAASGALGRLCAHAEQVGLANTDEFTFRSMFMAEAASTIRGLRFQTEWKTFDLLVQHADEPILIEFKYYLLRRAFALDGTAGGYKGGAGPKNESEFWKCVEKLATRAPSSVSKRILILVYQREYDRRSRYSYANSFKTLAPCDRVMRVLESCAGPFECRILQIVGH